MAAVSTHLTLHRYQRTNQAYVEDLGDGGSLTLMLILGGDFLMGAPADEPESDDNERPQHAVTVSPFLLGRYPVTQAQWRVVAAMPTVGRALEPDPSRFKGDDLPVEQVSWYEAVEFCQRLRRAHRPELSFTERSGVGVCVPGRNHDGLSLW